MPDVDVVGAGPNGPEAALVLARTGLSVHVTERESRPGGAQRTEKLSIVDGIREDAGSLALPLLGLHPAGPGRARHERQVGRHPGRARLAAIPPSFRRRARTRGECPNRTARLHGR
ncbi:hypothetical protein E3T40_07820 [Cryobacterium sp. TMT1-19]|uniref:NAD(P)-binding protein n=1 Tax=unclassified Cryobacterium TaxID=2649013 RepID=UPI000CE4C7C0|nr:MULTISPECIES: NAD(P)-binding protein [unclassified Cryobacterium]TFD36045.1 hypothetical protein E3T40_07820 [Cryobacterium sp. TMT1-19]